MLSSDLDAGPNLLMDWQRPTDFGRRWLRAGIGSAIVHVVFFLAALGVGSLEPPQPPNATEIASTIRKVTPLYAPPTPLTQRAPNRDKVSKEVNVEGLRASVARKSTPPVPPSRAFRPPDPTKTNPEPPPTTRIVEPPKIDTAATNPAAIAPLGVPKAPPPPQTKPVEKPKLVLENPGQYTTGPRPANSKIAPPGTTVDDAVHRVVHGLDAPPNIPGSMQMQPPQLELLSDPMGVDFKPYLIRILALVRQNWFAVIPQSARLGNRGITQLQFIIDRNGQVPKLVISDTSGSESLDKAAVAGVSASVPFPPLPQEFRGHEIRVQFAFKYNVK